MKKIPYSSTLMSALVTTLIGLGSIDARAEFFEDGTLANDSYPFDYNDSSGKQRAASQAQARYGGKVLSVSKSSRNGQTKYKVKLLLDSGRIKIVTIEG